MNSSSTICSLLQFPPEEYKVYFGVSNDIPSSLDGLTGKAITEVDLITKGISNRYTADGTIKKRSTDNLLADIGGFSCSADDGVLSFKLGKQ